MLCAIVYADIVIGPSAAMAQTENHPTIPKDIHQCGFSAVGSYTANPNASEYEGRKDGYYDRGLGFIHDWRHIFSPLCSIEAVSSISFSSAEILRTEDRSPAMKLILPVEGRCYFAMNDDVQMYLGVGAQWNAYSNSQQTAHQLGVNQSFGFCFFGPQKNRVHINVGNKIHQPVLNASFAELMPGQNIDISRDRTCMILNGGISFDLTRKKESVLLLNYEYPLGTRVTYPTHFPSSCQMLSIAILFTLNSPTN